VVAAFVLLMGLSLGPSWALGEERPLDADALSGRFVLAGEQAAITGLSGCDARHVTAERPNVKLLLISEHPQIAPGLPNRLALRFDLAPDWHIYYGPNPGGIGLPTVVKWRVPEGFVVSEPAWPPPIAYIEATGHLSNVYEDELFLYVSVATPEDLGPVSSIEVGVDVDYQLCSDRCIRGRASLDLSLPVVRETPQLPPPLWSRPFERAHAQLALTEPPSGMQVVGAVGQEPLRPGDETLLVLWVDAEEAELRGHSLNPTAKLSRPLLVWDRLGDLEQEVVAVDVPPQGGLRVVTRLALDEESELAPGAATLGGVLQIEQAEGAETWRPLALRVSVPLTVGAVGDTVTVASGELWTGLSLHGELERPRGAGAIPLWQALLFAFLGGLILNVMPCVLPVLSLKALALVEEAGEAKRSVLPFIGAYVGGVLASFWLLAGVMVALKLSGELVGWGFQFQEPAYVLTMVAVIFVFSLSMFGVFEIPGLSMSGQHSGLKGSFAHGVLTTALSTPCSAPLLGPALAFALSQSPAQIVVSLTVVGVGLSTPLALITLVPAARRFIPRPGAWMDTFKKLIAFLLVGTAIYLLGILGAQLSPGAMTRIYVFLGLLSMSAWILGHWVHPMATKRAKWIAGLAVTLILVGAVSVVRFDEARGDASLASARIDWQPFAGDETMDLVRGGQTVLLDFTADWCPTCKVNEQVAIETDKVAAKIQALGVLPVKADMTRRNPEADRWVAHFGRVAIPLVVVLPAGRPNDPILLPEVMTEGMLLEALDRAGPSR